MKSIYEIENELDNCFKLKKVADDIYKLEGDFFFYNDKKMQIFLKQIDNELFIADGKTTFAQMNEIYELNSKDVKACIQSVIKLYGFNVRAGEVLCKVANIKDLCKSLFLFVSCLSSLLGMFVFFENPSE